MQGEPAHPRHHQLANPLTWYIDGIEARRMPSHVYYQTNYNFSAVILDAIGGPGSWTDLVGNPHKAGEKGQTEIWSLRVWTPKQ